MLSSRVEDLTSERYDATDSNQDEDGDDDKVADDEYGRRSLDLDEDATITAGVSPLNESNLRHPVFLKRHGIILPRNWQRVHPRSRRQHSFNVVLLSQYEVVDMAMNLLLTYVR